MCGIFAYVGKKTNAAQIVLEGLKKLEYRGYDSWGVAVVPAVILGNPMGDSRIDSGQARMTKKIIVKKQTGKIGNASVSDLPASQLAFGHTRWATHGGVTFANAHPHLDCTARFALIHNGIVENYESLGKHLKHKHKLQSQTDTEILVHLIEELAEKYPTEEAIRLAFNQATGLNAIVVLDNRENKIYAAKTGSPIVIAVSGNDSYLASDSASLLTVSRNLLFLADEEMAIISGGKVELKNVKTGHVLPIHLEKIDWEVTGSDLGKYPFFMLKEIEEQPKVILSSLNLSEQVKKLALAIKNKNIYFTGCGSAYFAGVSGTYLLVNVDQRRSQAVIASEYDLLKHLGPKDTLIALSQSGETIDLIETVKKIKMLGVKVVAAVNVLGSTLYRMANEKILLGAGPEKSVCATKSFTAKICFLILLSYSLAGKEKVAQKLLVKAAEAADEVINQKRKLTILAKRLAASRDIFILGRGINSAIAFESALKIKEVTYRHAEGFAGGELKHGVIALVEKGTPCLVLAPNDENYDASLASAMELKARGAYVVGISPKNSSTFDLWLPVTDLGIATIIPMVVYAQLLAYYLGLELKLDVDKPRNLAKSVTVK